MGVIMADYLLHHTGRTSVGLIKQGSENPPLFLVHCLYGRVRFAYNLAGAMESRHTIYAIQPGIINGRVRPQRSLEDMAQGYSSCSAVWTILAGGIFIWRCCCF